MFGRRKNKDDDGEQLQDGVDISQAADDAADAADAEETSPVPERPKGPWDLADAPSDEINRIDLGGLRVPVPPDTEVRVDVSPEGEVVAATLVIGESAMQVNAFAAPRTAGIWTEVREEIAEALRSGGGQAEMVPGALGTELIAGIPAEGGGLAPARFLGVDGPRWFVRALLTGPAAGNREAAAPFEAALRNLVVVRGTDAMAVRDPLPLHLPRDVAEQAAQAQLEADEEASLAMPERGPEITELR